MNDFKKYLPSKKFIKTILIILILIGVFFAVKMGITALKRRSLDKNGNSIQMTVGKTIQKDTNKNGIEDWEEYLWGLDPSKNGQENKEFILAKKKDLEAQGLITQTGEENNSQITQNALLSRQLLATLISLQDDGGLDEETITTITETIGSEIKTTPIEDIYNKNMLTITADSPISKAKYLENWRTINSKYSKSDIGQELTIMAQGIVSNDKQAMYVTKTIASSYRNFGKDLSKLPVPSSLADIHLNLVNDYEKTARSIEGMTSLVDEPIVGMRGLLDYKKYSDELVDNIEKLTEILQ